MYDRANLIHHALDKPRSRTEGLKEIRDRYTPSWIWHYQDGLGPRPNDNYWRKFLADLRAAFLGQCAYCEENCPDEVDHFRPTSKFPELVYQWSNWIFTCSACNRAKGDKWPPEEYIDPCMESRRDCPEGYFTFDSITGSNSRERTWARIATPEQ